MPKTAPSAEALGIIEADENGVGVLVFGDAEAPLVGGVGAFAVDFAVDGEGRVSGVFGEHLGGASGGCEEYGLASEGVEGAHQGASERGFSRSGISVEEEERIGAARADKVGEPGNELGLLGVGGIGEISEYALGDVLIAVIHGAKIVKKAMRSIAGYGIVGL